MSKGPRVNQPSPPDWWNPQLYRDWNDLPLAGWIWEFMRRDRLKMLSEQPVEAMNPHRPDKQTPKYLALYYRPWHRLPPPWRSPGRIFTIPPAIRWEGLTPTFRHTYYDLSHYELEDGSLATDPLPPAQWVQAAIRIDMNRSDAVILQDLEIALKEARKKYPKPDGVKQRMQAWKDNQILEVWDLCEFCESEISWSRIIELPGMFKEKDNAYEAARNAYTTAKRLIEQKGWQDLALQVADILRVPKAHKKDHN